MWIRSESGDWTKNLGLKVGVKQKFPGKRDLDMTYIRALINNTGLGDNMYRYGLSDDCNCRCGKERETLEHILLRCELDEVARKRFRDCVKNLWMSMKCDGGLNIDMNMILAPFTNSKLKAKDADEILNLSFDFLKSLSRKF